MGYQTSCRASSFFKRRYGEKVPDPRRSAFAIYPSWAIILAIFLPLMVVRFVANGILKSYGVTIEHPILVSFFLTLVLLALWMFRCQYLYFDDTKIVYARSRWWCVFVFKRQELYYSEMAGAVIDPQSTSILLKGSATGYATITFDMKDGRRRSVVMHAGERAGINTDTQDGAAFLLLTVKLSSLGLI